MSERNISPCKGTLRGLNFADFADLGKIAKLSPSEKFATGEIKSSQKKLKSKTNPRNFQFIFKQTYTVFIRRKT